MRTVSVVHNVFKTENNALYIIPVYKESKKKAVSQEKSRLTAFCVRFGHNVLLTITHLRELWTQKLPDYYWKQCLKSTRKCRLLF